MTSAESLYTIGDQTRRERESLFFLIYMEGAEKKIKADTLTLGELNQIINALSNERKERLLLLDRVAVNFVKKHIHSPEVKDFDILIQVDCLGDWRIKFSRNILTNNFTQDEIVHYSDENDRWFARLPDLLPDAKHPLPLWFSRNFCKELLQSNLISKLQKQKDLWKQMSGEDLKKQLD